MSDPRTAPSAETRIAIETVLARVDNLPTLPIVAMRVGEMVNDPGSSAQQVAQVMQRDPSLSAKVLRLVNSPYYAIPGGVSDVQRAISFIGFNTLHQLVLGISVMSALKTPTGARFNAGGLWLHSLAVGVCADVLARHIGYRDPGSCFTAGLLHDVGKIALASAVPEEFGTALDCAHRDGRSMAETERDAGLPSHDRVGSRLARRWKFPSTLLVPIEQHHSASRASVRRELSSTLLAIVDVVNVADELVRMFQIGDSGSPAPEKHDVEALERIGLSVAQVDRIYGEVMRKLETSRMFLELVDYRP